MNRLLGIAVTDYRAVIRVLKRDTRPLGGARWFWSRLPDPVVSASTEAVIWLGMRP